jgi:diaminopimelate epimerase
MQTEHLHFTKMHGLGNDFVILNLMDQALDLHRLPIAELAHRHIGIGFDQLLLIEASTKADFFCRIFNADGSEAEQCGNGLRCVARFIHEQGLETRKAFSIETLAGIYSLSIDDYDHIHVTMGAPDIKEKLLHLPLSHRAMSIPISVLSVGNPHAIVKIESIHSAIPDQLGPEIASHSYFPQGVNVGFMQILNPHHILLRTFERGAGETLACGSNACAAAVAGISNAWLQKRVSVEFRYGTLTIEWGGGDQAIHMIGPATKVFEGRLPLK